MRIAIVTATFPPYRGGTGNVAYHHARLMHERGHEVTVFTAVQKNKDAQLPAFPFTVHYLPVIFRLGNAPLTPSLTKGLDGFDVIHLHYPYIFGAELTMRASRRYGVPFVVTYHNDLIANGLRGFLFKVYTRTAQPKVLKAARLVMATSEDYAQHCFLKDIPGLIVRAVPNGVDVEHFSPGEGVRPEGVPKESPLALFVGALDKAHYFKGLPVLLQAISELPDWHLAVVGDGDLKETYQLTISNKEVQNRVHWMGAVDETLLRNLYRGATVTVLPSTTLGEAFGLVLVESMACGTPVIASDLPGVRSVVPTQEQLGWLVTPQDVNVLTNVMRNSVTMVGRNESVGLVTEWVVERFSWERIGERLNVLYEETFS